MTAWVAIGSVSAAREPIVRLRVRGPSGLEVEVDATVDTGFTGALTLPATVVTSLRLVWLTDEWSSLADGSRHRYAVHVAEVEWGGAARTVPATVLGPRPLIGMTLLDGFELRVEARVGGAVEIRPLPAPPP
jgi:clan AA aspartic protease